LDKLWRGFALKPPQSTLFCVLSPGEVLVRLSPVVASVTGRGQTFCHSVARCRPARGGDMAMFLLILISNGDVVTCYY
ncbi:hypothetical protein A2U01_0093341, partial [Trifolium medium]|nr:hypothetical protein [Trifolium medium]